MLIISTVNFRKKKIPLKLSAMCGVKTNATHSESVGTLCKNDVLCHNIITTHKKTFLSTD